MSRRVRRRHKTPPGIISFQDAAEIVKKFLGYGYGKFDGLVREGKGPRPIQPGGWHSTRDFTKHDVVKWIADARGCDAEIILNMIDEPPYCDEENHN